MSSEVVRLDTFRPDVVEAVLSEVGMTRQFAERLETQLDAALASEGPTAQAIASSLNATLQVLYERMAVATLGLASGR